MTDKEKIIAEIERLKEVFVPTVNVEYQDFSKFLLDLVIDSINSLPSAEEQPSEELVDAARNIRDTLYLEEGKRDDYGNPYFLQDTILKAVIAGAQWQKEQMIKSAVSIGYLQDWYQNSIDEEVPPIWTDEHLNELTKDFYIIPKQKEDEQCSTE